ncbi:AAA family ATPase [Bifidobacterium myosotis]|uniref:AAA family ATPase n=1 Tax=Bifidobacterium myosotis TaxID=1630166 RepID=UPI00168B19B6|nr:AAA family ATPase [Bifidobacterium myosotis]
MDDARNTRHGTVAFRDLASGASVTGLYGQNGSGKTTVIDAIRILRNLMAGRPAGPEAVGFIRQGSGTARIAAVLDVDGAAVEYTAALERADGTDGARVAGERLERTPAGGRRRLLMEHTLAAADRMGLRPWRTLPHVRWRSLRSVGSADALLSAEETLAHAEGRSFILSPAVARTLADVASAVAAMPDASRSRRDAADGTLAPLTALTARLGAWARDDVRVVTTRTGSSVSFDYAPLGAGGERGDVLDISRPVRIPADLAPAVRRMAAQADTVMPALVPGLHVAADMRDVTLADGTAGVEVFLRSVRDDVSIPLWAESEGVRRIMGILSLLVRMFNEEDALVAIDEIDAGVFEILLGDLLATLAGRGVGQLVFTAHDLRVLEALGPESIVFSTTDPSDRFTALRARDTNNLRSMYIRAVKLADHGGVMADRVDRSAIAMALYDAGGAGDDDGE